MKSLKRFAAIAVMAVMGFVAGNTAFAQVECSCTINGDGCKEVTFFDPFGNIISTEVFCGTEGVGNFECSRELPPTGPINTSPIPVSLETRVFSPTYGVIQTISDPERRSSPAIIRSLGKERFPAYARISFYVRVKVEATGCEYCSTEELVFESYNVRSYPFVNEKFCLANDVKLVPCIPSDDCGYLVLHAGTTCVVLN